MDERKTHTHSIGRMYFVSPKDHERFHLRALLSHISGATSFQDMLTVHGEVCNTYKEAATKLGLAQDDRVYFKAMEEAHVSATPHQLRRLFCSLTLYCNLSEPHKLLTAFENELAEDDLNIYGVAQTNNYIRHHTLQKIEIILRENGSTLGNFPPLSTPNMDNTNIGRENSLILHDIRTYTIDEQLSLHLQPTLSSLMDRVDQVKHFYTVSFWRMSVKKVALQ